MLSVVVSEVRVFVLSSTTALQCTYTNSFGSVSIDTQDDPGSAAPISVCDITTFPSFTSVVLNSAVTLVHSID